MLIKPIKKIIELCIEELASYARSIEYLGVSEHSIKMPQV